MTDTLAAGVEDVRAAASALKAAIDRHLAAVEVREGAGDTVVQQAYSELHDAAERYDDLLFEVYDEVTPFVLAEGHEETVSEIGGVPDRYEETGWVSMLARWNFKIVDRERLLDAGQAAAEAMPGGDAEGIDDQEDASDVSIAFGQLIDGYGRDELAARAAEFGLGWQGVTTWVLDADPVEDEAWMDAAFAVDEDRLIYRLDEVYADESVAEDDEDEFTA